MATKKLQILDALIKQAQNADMLDGKHADEFAAAPDVEELKTKVGDAPVSEQINEALENNKPDWNASEGEPGYIANRTHWVEKSQGEILPETTPTYDEDNAQFILTTPLTNTPSVGGLYTVIWNGQNYECLSQEVEGMPAIGNIGALTGTGDSGEPFIITFVPEEFQAQMEGITSFIIPLDGTTELILSVNGEIKKCHPLDQSYLPYNNSNLINGEALYSLRQLIASKPDEEYSMGEGAIAFGSNTKASGHGAHAEGGNTLAAGISSHAEGVNTSAYGDYSHAEGSDTISNGRYSHAEGDSTVANGKASHAEGISTNAFGKGSHAEGYQTLAYGEYSLASGSGGDAGRTIYLSGGGYDSQGKPNKKYNYSGSNVSVNAGHIIVYQNSVYHVTEVSGSQITLDNAISGSYVSSAPATLYTHGSFGQCSHTGGLGCIAGGQAAFAYGSGSRAFGSASVALGQGVNTYGTASLGHGSGNTVRGNSSFVSGAGNTVDGGYSAAFGTSNTVKGNYSAAFGANNNSTNDFAFTFGTSNTPGSAHTFSFGNNNKVNNTYSFASGTTNTINGQSATAFGTNNNISGNSSMGVGDNITISSAQSFAFGNGCSVSDGQASFAGGSGSKATNSNAFAFGGGCTASGYSSFAFGGGCTASEYGSMAFGGGCTASGSTSLAFGSSCRATGSGAVAIGGGCRASGKNSFACGTGAYSNGDYSYAQGLGSQANGISQYVFGRYNLVDFVSESDDKSKYLHIIGNGKSETERSNAHTLDWDGNAWYQTSVRVGGTDQDAAATSLAANGLILTDEATGTKYRVFISNAKLNMEVVE